MTSPATAREPYSSLTVYSRARARAAGAALRGQWMRCANGCDSDLASVSGLVHVWAVSGRPLELISGCLRLMVIQMCYVLMTQAES